MVRTSSSVRRERYAESCVFQEISPSRTAMPCWRRLQATPAGSIIFPKHATASALFTAYVNSDAIGDERRTGLLKCTAWGRVFALPKAVPPAKKDSFCGGPNRDRRHRSGDWHQR